MTRHARHHLILLVLLCAACTDAVRPPTFKALAKQRGLGSNSPGYAGAALAAVQTKAYPDIAPLVFDLNVQDVFDVAATTLKRGKLKMEIVTEEPPSNDTSRPGLIEAVDRTLVIGFADDVVVRIAGDQVRTRIDIRSQSRYGRHDLGQNAKRVRAMLKEIGTRVEATLLTPGGRMSGLKRDRASKLIKRPIARGQTAETPRSGSGAARGDAQRGPQQKAKQLSPDERRARDKRLKQSQE